MPQEDEQIARGLACVQKPKKSIQHLCTVCCYQRYTDISASLSCSWLLQTLERQSLTFNKLIRSWLSAKHSWRHEWTFNLSSRPSCRLLELEGKCQTQSHGRERILLEVSDWGAPGASRVITQTRAPTQKFREASFRQQCGKHKGSFACREPLLTCSAEGCKIVTIVA